MQCVEANPAFLRWFGESKVVDCAGRPLVVYHGTDAEIEVFDRRKMREGRYGKAFHFTDDPERAAAYGKIVMKVYLKIERPNTRTGNSDGLIIGSEAGNRIFTVYDPKQIKSATGNCGAFDPNIPNIRS